MNNVFFLRKPSKNGVSKKLARGLGIPSIIVGSDGERLDNNVIGENDTLINYGVAGNRWRLFADRNPMINKCTVINAWNQINKYEWVNLAKNLGLITPPSVQRYGDIKDRDNWIAKPYYSKAGKGIVTLNDYLNQEGQTGAHYFQKRVENRKYELRVTFFDWLNSDQWLVWKRVMENDKGALTWNHHTGGKFIWVNEPNNFDVFVKAKKQTELLMKGSDLNFGAVDFIVDHDYNSHFLEVNTLPGFSTNDNYNRYLGAFKELLRLINEP